MATPARSSHHRWTRAEDTFLRRRWHLVALRTLRAGLPGRSWLAIYARATHLGLPHGTPQGMSTLHALHTTTGFPPYTLSRLMAWAEVKAVRVYGPRPGSGPVWVAYDTYDALRALDTWLQGETVAAAAARLGMLIWTLRSWLKDAPTLKNRPRPAGLLVRYSRTTIDRVVRAHAGRATKKLQHAPRLPTARAA